MKYLVSLVTFTLTLYLVNVIFEFNLDLKLILIAPILSTIIYHILEKKYIKKK
ncbi:Group-specific protein [Candidatus Ornithobacterium hominis]|nr:Group-specific protein [Candidatus Ornithobacterium hominis]